MIVAYLLNTFPTYWSIHLNQNNLPLLINIARCNHCPINENLLVPYKLKALKRPHHSLIWSLQHAHTCGVWICDHSFQYYFHNSWLHIYSFALYYVFSLYSIMFWSLAYLLLCSYFSFCFAASVIQCHFQHNTQTGHNRPQFSYQNPASFLAPTQSSRSTRHLEILMSLMKKKYYFFKDQQQDSTSKSKSYTQISTNSHHLRSWNSN